MNKLEMVAKLKRNEAILNYSEPGNSMLPLIKSRQPVSIYPVMTDCLEKGDIVFCKVNGRFFTHKVTAIKDDQIQISNNHGYVNGWTSKRNIFGIVGKIEDKVITSALSKMYKYELPDWVNKEERHYFLPASDGIWTRVCTNQKSLYPYYWIKGKLDRKIDGARSYMLVEKLDKDTVVYIDQHYQIQEKNEIKVYK